MIIKNVELKDKTAFNRLALHPLQSWEWGEFRKKTGLEVIRLGKYEKDKLLETAQITLHPLPFTMRKIGYFPKGEIPSREMLKELVNIGKQRNCIFIKLEPNVKKDMKILRDKDIKILSDSKKSPNILISQYPNIYSSPHPLFTRYTFQIDLAQSEEEILKNLHPKTRYNIKVATKHGVYVEEDNSDEAFENYLKLTEETTRRQKFFAHSLDYHRLMWETLKPAGIAHLLVTRYPYEPHTDMVRGEGINYTLVTWVVFLFNKTLYYPYGASSEKFKNVMASTLMMWKAIKFGKANGAKTFDLWGALGPNPNPKDPWYGFHRFKQGFNPRLIEFAGSFDLVINPTLYHIYNYVYKLREIFLLLKSEGIRRSM